MALAFEHLDFELGLTFELGHLGFGLYLSFGFCHLALFRPRANNPTC
jgi:hypothetical protein